MHAETITVTSSADNGPGTLREALADSTDGDTINFAVTGIITLSSGELRVTNRVTINGPGPKVLAIDGNGASRVFHVGPFTSLGRGNDRISYEMVHISNLTITNGFTVYGPGCCGGGIYNDRAMLTVSNCTVTGNLAESGGGIFNDGSVRGARLIVVSSRIVGNSALDGGGVFNGGLFGNAIMQIVNSTISDNLVGIYLDYGNGTGSGAGVFNHGELGRAVLDVDNCTITDNNTSYYGWGSGIFNDGYAGSAPLRVRNSTISRNWNAGVFNLQATARLGNCTVSGNRNGLQNFYGRLKVSNCTFSGNSGNSILNNDCYSDTFFGSKLGAKLEIGSSILDAGNRISINSYCGGAVKSRGHNLSSDAAGGDDGTGPGGWLNAIGDKRNTDPLLGPLQDNSGPTLTHALLPGSPAIDQGKRRVNGCLRSYTDQRGFPRPVDDPNVPNALGGDGSDIGAFEAAE